MKLLTKVIFLTFFIQTIQAQTIDPKKLDNQISLLNDKHSYEKSFTILENILEDPKATHYDKFNAHLQKYYTYKRVTDYTSAMESLENAKEEGMRSDKREEALTKIVVEDIFNKIQLQQFEQVAGILKNQENKININLLDDDTKGFFLCTVAIIDIIAKEYIEAEKHLDEAIEVFKKSNPKHIANVYRKKMDLFKELGNEALMISNYEKGVFYAKKYNVEIYEKNLYDSMVDYYRDINNPKLVKYYSELSRKSSIQDYKNVERSSNLKKLKLKLRKEKEKRALENQQYTIIIFSIISFLLIILAFYFYKQYKTNKKTRIIAEESSNKMYQELQQVLQLANNDNITAQSKESELSERQTQILELLKQGKTNKEIAGSLYISENTVKYHLKIIYNILDIKHRSQVIA